MTDLPIGHDGQPHPINLCQQLREAVGLFAGAMPCTPEQAWEEAIARVRRLREGFDDLLHVSEVEAGCPGAAPALVDAVRVARQTLEPRRTDIVQRAHEALTGLLVHAAGEDASALRRAIRGLYAPGECGPIVLTTGHDLRRTIRMTQTRLGSLIEASANVLIGYLVALASQLLIFPMVGVYVSFGTNLEIGAWFTLISLARSYLLRRFFNARLHAAAQSLARKAA